MAAVKCLSARCNFIFPGRFREAHTGTVLILEIRKVCWRENLSHLIFVLRNLILQTRTRSHTVGLDVWYFVELFVYFHKLCVRTAKALTRLRGWLISSTMIIVKNIYMSTSKPNMAAQVNKTWFYCNTKCHQKASIKQCHCILYLATSREILSHIKYSVKG